MALDKIIKNKDPEIAALQEHLLNVVMLLSRVSPEILALGSVAEGTDTVVRNCNKLYKEWEENMHIINDAYVNMRQTLQENVKFQHQLIDFTRSWNVFLDQHRTRLPVLISFVSNLDQLEKHRKSGLLEVVSKL